LKTLVATKKGKSTKNKMQLKLMNRFSEFTALHDVALQTWVTCVTLSQHKKMLDENKMKNIIYLLGKTVTIENNVFAHILRLFKKIVGRPHHLLDTEKS